MGGEIIKRRKFLSNKNARIPFSVIGIFLILGSTMTTVYVAKLETDKSIEIADTIDFNEIETLLRRAEADMSTALNIAGLKGLREIGEKPVIEPPQGGCSFGNTADEINKNRVKQVIMNELNIYLTSNYYYDNFNNKDYAINVKVPLRSNGPIQSRDEITFEYKSMDFERFSLEFIGPKSSDSHCVYWIANLPITVEIKKINGENSGTIITKKTVNINTILTSRYSFLKNLMQDYKNQIDGAFSSLFTYTTLLTNIYSLARGYKHYNSGLPMNVVANKHLRPILNSGLLLQQGFTFGSVDPMALVELSVETIKAIKNQNPVSNTGDLQNFFSDVDGDGLDVTPKDFSKGSANIDAGDDENTHIDQRPKINVTEIAEIPLHEYDSIKLTFQHPSTGNIRTRTLVDFTEQELKDVIEEAINDGYNYLGREKQNPSKNPDTVDKIQEITEEIYSTKLKTIVTRGTSSTTLANHTGYPIDNGTDGWEIHTYTCTDTITKPAKGQINPSNILHAKKYEVTFKRNHYWSNHTNNTWREITVKDTKIEENATVKITLEWYSKYDNTENDIVDIFYYNNTYDDLNLKDTIDDYKNTVYTSSNLENWLDDKRGDVHSQTLIGLYKNWVETQAWNALEEIFNMVKEIKQSSDINSDNYPNPYNLMQEAKNDILQKFYANKTLYLNKQDYKKQGLFKSTGQKSVFFIRKWYVEKIEQDIIDAFNEAKNKMDQHLEDSLNDAGTSTSVSDVKNALSNKDASDYIKNQFVIPFGYDITLKDEWTEKIKIGVEQKPNYLKDSDLEIKNTCFLGPTGLPLLPPTPATPWVVSTNVWPIQVNGAFEEIKLIDATDETIFNPLFGHDPQTYVRRDEEIKIEGETIGYNKKLEFEFTTACFSIVPSWGLMVGDTNGVIIEG